MALNILVVDDNKDLVSLLMMYLTKKGYATKGAYTLSEAIDLLSKEKYDLVITDAFLHEFNGLTLLKSIKSRGQSIPVVLMSGHAKADQVYEYLKSGAYDFLFKPFRLEILAKIIEGIDDRNKRLLKMGVMI